ncbi:hypothetical protein ACFQ2Z_14790 [Paenibacillus timonensis]|uniref:Uncharacterized protein n=1 Tax=Paenibacillus timonensis TaxID=225915 RepID=A0ABW3SDI8_9BACL|nr:MULTISPECIES: hypothetical protein [Paenibacillus]MDU2240776.1 hypothetical protein [Paenibacillus sp.]
MKSRQITSQSLAYRSIKLSLPHSPIELLLAAVYACREEPVRRKG